MGGVTIGSLRPYLRELISRSVDAKVTSQTTRYGSRIDRFRSVFSFPFLCSRHSHGPDIHGPPPSGEGWSPSKNNFSNQFIKFAKLKLVCKPNTLKKLNNFTMKLSYGEVTLYFVKRSSPKQGLAT